MDINAEACDTKPNAQSRALGDFDLEWKELNMSLKSIHSVS